MDDLISRQAAIDALDTLAESYADDTDDDYFTGCYSGVNRSIDAIKTLPAAQPEIIHCKDCKHHWTHGCMDSMPIERCDLGQTFYDAEVDFCSLAEKREVNHESN